MSRQQQRIPAWRLRDIRDREVERQARYHGNRTVLVGLGTQDPNAVHDWSRSLVKAVYGDDGYRCLDCRPRALGGELVIDTEPETPCVECGHPVCEATARRAS